LPYNLVAVYKTAVTLCSVNSKFARKCKRQVLET